MSKHDGAEELRLSPTGAEHDDRERLLEAEGERGETADKLAPVEAQETMLRNLVSNYYAWIAQGGIVLLVLIIWGACFNAGLIFFSAHVLLNSTGILLITQSILVLQPTSTPIQKRRGTAFHFIFNTGSLSALLSGLVIIEMNKFDHDGEHFRSTHAVLGLITYLFLLAQGVVGFTQYYTPMVYGSVDKAKSIWKYHRMSGYVTITLGLLTVVAAMTTGYNENVLHIPMWLVVGCAMLVGVGIVPRISLKKFGHPFGLGQR